MPLTVTPHRFVAIREAIYRRRTEALAAEIDAVTDGNDQHFSDVDDFMSFLDTQVEQSEPHQ